VSGGVLTAELRDKDGAWRAASAAFLYGDALSNQDGRFRVDGGGDVAGALANHKRGNDGVAACAAALRADAARCCPAADVAEVRRRHEKLLRNLLADPPDARHVFLILSAMTTNEHLKGTYSNKPNPHNRGICSNLWTFLSEACPPSNLVDLSATASTTVVAGARAVAGNAPTAADVAECGDAGAPPS
jgi:hypothetical protein